MRVLSLPILALMMSILLTEAALAHAFPAQEIPKSGAVLAVPPEIVSITFTEEIDAHFSGIIVTNQSGQRVDDGDILWDTNNRKILSVGMKKGDLPAGVYKVIWHALSTDGHRTEGSYEFTETK
jgi:methionine-rich copper-binding protein CopC